MIGKRSSSGEISNLLLHLDPLILTELLERIIPPEELTGELELLSKELSQAKEKILEFEEKGMEFAELWKVKLVETPVHGRAVVNLRIPGIRLPFGLLIGLLTSSFATLKRQNLVVEVNLFDNPLNDEAMFYFADFLASNNTLTKLCLAQTALTEMGVYFLAKALAKNRSVRTLELFSNPITPIGWYFLSCALAVNPTLEKLGMAGCKPVDNTFIKAFYLSAAILENSKNGGVLRSLNVHDTALEDKGAMALALALQENPPLKDLDVGSCGITFRGIREIFEALRSNYTLDSLAAWRNPFGQSMKMLLSFVVVLSQLNMEDSGVNDEAMPTVASLLQTNTLTYLNLGTNPFTKLGASILAAALEINTSLQKLALYRTESALVTPCLRLNSSLTLLNLGTNKIGELPLQEVSQERLVNLSDSEKIPFCREAFWMFIQMSCLSSILLNSNNLRDEGAKALAQVLSTKKTLTYCNIASNEIGPEGIAALASALAICCLVSLNLGDNLARDEGAESLAQSLRANTCLTLLDLSKNHIGNGGVNSIGGLLSVNSGLKTLSLADNRSGPEIQNAITYLGARSLGRALSDNTCLQTLDLSETNIGRKGANDFLSLVSANTSLTKLTLPAQIPVDIATKFGIFARGNEKLLRNKERTLRGLCEVQIIRMRY